MLVDVEVIHKINSSVLQAMA